MFNRTKNAIKNALRSWLKLTSATGLQIQIDELLDFEANAFVNEIWFRGDGYEIEQLYKAIPDYKYSFWGSAMTRGLEIRKIHTGLPKIIVNTLTNICVDDMQDVKIAHIGKENTWGEIERENDWKNLVKKAVKNALVTGDGAFKISVDTDMSQYPILEFYEADRIEVKRERGRVKEIRFKKCFDKQGVSYVLKECYGSRWSTCSSCSACCRPPRACQGPAPDGRPPGVRVFGREGTEVRPRPACPAAPGPDPPGSRRSCNTARSRKRWVLSRRGSALRL